MGRYDKEIKFLSKVENINGKEFSSSRRKLTELEIKEFKKQYVNIPKEYLDYLIEIGEGSIRECQFHVYGCLLTLSDIYSDYFHVLSDEILFFGDDYSGNLTGFDTNKKWEIVEFWHDSEELYYPNKTFQEYIQHKIFFDSAE